MLYRVTDGFSLGGGRDVYPGEVVELTEGQAAQLGLRRLERVAVGEKTEDVPRAEPIEPETREPKATRRSRRGGEE